MPAPDDLIKLLTPHGQTHLVAFWQELDEPTQRKLSEQIRTTDFRQVRDLYERHVGKISAPGSHHAAERAKAPADLVRQPKSQHETEEWRRAAKFGEGMLSGGKVGAILVAGGQGTRLGFNKPKGMFHIGPVSKAPLFQILAEQVLARSRRAGQPIPYYVMTSDATHHDTEEFFRLHHYFGLNPEDVFFFKQGNMPAVDATTGKLLLAEKDSLALSPDGHGGILAALKTSGALDDMARRGIEYLHYHQVDNPTAIVCDPAFIGWHALKGSEISTKVVAKVSPTEKMGVVCDVDGCTQIIEYSDLSDELAHKRNEQGEPIFWAGNTAIHVLTRSFLERLCDGSNDLPFHVAHKKVPFINEQGEPVEPTSPNAFKFERFIFDALPLASKALVVEADRQREFNPVKNAEGADSPATSQAALLSLARGWLRNCGCAVADDCCIEISPLFALDEEELGKKVSSGTRYESGSYLRETERC
jgi:UDP-N-acetylglucosamine/UDP-N-acetylgalactosamine diphosphorylase